MTQLPWQMLVPLSVSQGLVHAFPPTQAVLLTLGNGSTEGRWFYQSCEVPASPSGTFSSWFLQLQVFNQRSKEVFQGNLTKESAGFTSDCSVCVLCLSSARHAVAFRQGKGLVKGKVSNGDPKRVLFKAVRENVWLEFSASLNLLIAVLSSSLNLAVFLLRHRN